MDMSEQQRATVCSIIDGYTSGEDKKIPGLVYLAFRGDGEPVFQHCSGTIGVSSEQPMSLDTTFWVASFTKLATSVACMQLVEWGVLRLDDADQVEGICPQLGDVSVLARDENGYLRLVEKSERITLRMLLNHTAGYGYAFEDEKLAEWARPVGTDDFAGDKGEVLSRPLVNQPGQTFQYGTSLDIVGIIIEKVTGLTLEEYFQKRIFEPLGIRGLSFHPTEHEKDGLAYMHQRLEGGSLRHVDHLYRAPLVTDKKDVFCAGGHGCFGKPADFMRLIATLLNSGTCAKTGAQLLRPETVEEMFRDQIPDKPRYSNVAVPVAKPWLANPTPLVPMPDDHTEGWGLSFSISHFPADSGRSAGSGSWEGLANLYWFADRKNDVGGIIATQILPYGDRQVVECSDRVEAEIYRALGLPKGTA